MANCPPTLKELLDRALNAEEGYLGPTVGQVISVYFADQHHICGEIAQMFRQGLSSDAVLQLTRVKYPELTEHHVAYVKKHFFQQRGKE